MYSRLVAMLLVSGLAGSATAQPKVIEIKTSPIQPGQVEEIRKRLLEDVEMAQAQRDTRKEQLKAAEVALDVAKRKVGMGNDKEKADAQAAVDLAMAAVDVRKAELKEAELKVVQNKRRYDSGIFPLVLTPVPTPAVFPPVPVVVPPPEKNSDAPAAKKDGQPQVIVTQPIGPRSKAPARVGFPTPQDNLALLQVELEVANLRFELAQTEVNQFQKLGINGEQMDASKARFEDAKKSLNAVEDKVLKAAQKIDPFAK